MSIKDDHLVCKCFYTDNYFIKRLHMHVKFQRKEEFLRSYNQILFKECTREDVDDIVKELEDESQRRHSIGRVMKERQEIIQQKYIALHPHVYHLQEGFLSPEFLEIVHQCQKHNNPMSEILSKLHTVKGPDRIYQIPVFTTNFCQDFVEEILHFENDSRLPKGRPNTMNKYGVILKELGFDEHFLTPLRERYLSPICSLLFPNCGGSLDSHRAFVVSYSVGKDIDLDLHFDNGEVTLNVSLDDHFEGGEIYYGPMYADEHLNSDPLYTLASHRLGFGLLHRSQQLHGAMPVTSGARHNLIIWMRSSVERNKRCPMCGKKPELVETEGSGDGFTHEQVDVCCTV